MRKNLRIPRLLTALVVLVAAPLARADLMTWWMSNVFSGSPASLGSDYVLLQMTDVGPDVEITITSHLSGGAFMDNLYINFTPDGTIPAVSAFSVARRTGSFLELPLETQQDAFKADGDGYYDILAHFENSNDSALRFDLGDSITYRLSSARVWNFIDLSSPGGGNGPFYAAAHIQGLSDGSSVWVSPGAATPVIIPAPAAVSLGVIGLALVSWRVRRPV